MLADNVNSIIVKIKLKNKVKTYLSINILLKGKSFEIKEHSKLKKMMKLILKHFEQNIFIWCFNKIISFSYSKGK